MSKKQLGFVLNLIALFIFIPGIMLPMFSLSMEMSAQLGASSLTSQIINKELSLLSTIVELWQDQRLLVATLIFIFSICIPLLKGILVCYSYLKKHSATEAKLLNFVAKIGKWSMADVFVIAIFLAVLSTNHAETADSKTLALLTFKIDLLISSETLSAVGLGFYYFSGYCLLSLLGTHFSLASLAINKAT
jgi:hypothetical protein